MLIQDLVNDPITLLQEVVAQQEVDGFTFEGVALNITSQTPIVFGTTPNQAAPMLSVAVPDGGGGIENIPFLVTKRGLGAGLCNLLDNDGQPSEAERELPPVAICADGAAEFPDFACPRAHAPNFSWPHIAVGTLTRDFG